MAPGTAAAVAPSAAVAVATSRARGTPRREPSPTPISDDGVEEPEDQTPLEWDLLPPDPRYTHDGPKGPSTQASECGLLPPTDQSPGHSQEESGDFVASGEFAASSSDRALNAAAPA